VEHAVIDRWDWNDLPRLLRKIQTIAPDVVDIHFNGWVYRDHPMITFLPAICKRLCPRIRVITHIESVSGCDVSKCSKVARLARRIMSEYVGRKGLSFEYGTLVRDSDKLIVLSERHRTLLESRTGCKTNSETIPPPPIMPLVSPLTALKRTEVRTELGCGKDTVLLAYFGYVYRVKGWSTFCRCSPM